MKINKHQVRKEYKNGSEEVRNLLLNIFGEEFFNADISEIIQSFDDVLEFHGIKKASFNSRLRGLSEDEKIYRKLKLIKSTYNDRTGEEKYKYYPVFDSRGVVLRHHEGYDYKYMKLFLFNNKDHAYDAGTKFRNLYEQFLNL